MDSYTPQQVRPQGRIARTFTDTGAHKVVLDESFDRLHQKANAWAASCGATPVSVTTGIAQSMSGGGSFDGSSADGLVITVTMLVDFG